MARGKAQKSTNYYGFKAGSSKAGKAHPPGIGGNPDTVEKYDKGAPGPGKMPSGGTHYPKGVVRGAGTEPRGSNPTSKRGAKGTTGSGSKPKWPSGVTGNGTSAHQPRDSQSKPSSTDSD